MPGGAYAHTGADEVGSSDPPGRIGGSLTALITPFVEGGSRIDEHVFADLVAWQIAEGTDGLVVGGTTGEAPTLSLSERDRLLCIAVEVAAGRVPIIAGTGTNCTRTSLGFTQVAKAAGADAALVVTPYYNKPTQEGLYQHFAVIARTVDLPLLLYIVPSRTGVDLSPSTLTRLAAIPTIIGIKDATGDLGRPAATARAAGPAFLQLSGHDATAAAFNLAGGRGCISVVANVAPRLCAELQRACRMGDYLRAAALQAHLAPLIAALERETNPGPVKLALSLLRTDVVPDLRLPLVVPRPETATAIVEALEMLRGDEAREPVDRSEEASRAA
ncbi:4-hydroxy-tetrahydrodipicolinate synthase [Methylobacterium crusticola]|uniref:4-hydroxy-tetrahydrodipicolinate synthase n=1 Tax=Methylobacterium crusticola TaxID=1697972 RepID=A0ABQ4R8D1_9HYPH|nr:4-hydroxy-tetrahydrodipicolinate synthase [Methylobacterium crusticola]GJD53993.1 4-hydroxy-tetrahydrodipicolinate synthase [Methylobacterium crusticola]